MWKRPFPRHVLLAAIAIAAAAAGPALAQDKKPAVEPPGQAIKPPGAEPVVGAPRVIPELRLDNQYFSDLINFLREVDPSFQAVVSYQSGPENKGPLIQELHLKNVTVATVLQLLSQTYNGIVLNTVDTPEGMIYTIRVSDDRADGLFGGEAPRQTRKVDAKLTTVHRLREIVDEMSARDNAEGARKRALSSVMSLVQAAVETAGEGAEDRRPGAGDVRLNLHEGTETLVFKGSGTQAQLVQATLESLTPPRDDRVRAATERAEEARRATESAVRELRASHAQQQQLKERAVELGKTVATLNAEMEQMRVRLGEWQKRYGAQAPPATPPGGPPAVPAPPASPVPTDPPANAPANEPAKPSR